MDLDRLLDRAETLTLKRLRRQGELSPGVLLYSKARGALVVPLPWRSPEEKIGMLGALRDVMAAAGVEAYAIWSECWMSSVEHPGNRVDLAQLPLPSQDPAAIDAVVIVAAEKGRPAVMRMWEVKKSVKGRVTLTQIADDNQGMFAGRLGELLGKPALDA